MPVATLSENIERELVLNLKNDLDRTVQFDWSLIQNGVEVYYLYEHPNFIMPTGKVMVWTTTPGVLYFGLPVSPRDKIQMIFWEHGTPTITWNSNVLTWTEYPWTPLVGTIGGAIIGGVIGYSLKKKLTPTLIGIVLGAFGGYGVGFVAAIR